MSKTIKFNLICDNKPVRTIEDLLNNFSIEDVLTYYNNKLLHRWLDVRGYSEELEKINGIDAEKPIEIIKELIKIFNVVCDDKKVEESVYMLEFLDEHQVLCSEYDKQKYKSRIIIDDYQAGYRQLVDGILYNPDDVAKIKANIAEIAENYAWILELNHRNLFYVLKDKSALAIMCLLMNGKARNYYIPIKVQTEYGTEVFDTELNDDKATMYQLLCSMITYSSFVEQLGNELLSFSGITDGYWKDLEPKGKKFMIISMGSGDYVRSAGIQGGDLAKPEVTNKFVIIDGIDYKSNSSTHNLLYMEV